MLIRSLFLLLLLASTGKTALADSSFSYDLVIAGTDGQFSDSDEAEFPQVGGQIRSAPSERASNAAAVADCGFVLVDGGAIATGPRTTTGSALTNPRARFSDEITIGTFVPGSFDTGTVRARIDFFGVPVATSDGPTPQILASGGYGLGVGLGNCGAGCGYGAYGTWALVNGQTVVNGDPIASFETLPTLFGYGVPLPFSLEVGMEAFATPPLTNDQVTSGGYFGASFSIIEIRDDQGNDIDPEVISSSGCEYVPEPFAPTIGAGMLAALASMRRRPKKLNPSELS